MNQELDNIFNSAKQAMADDLRLNYYNAAQERNFYFRQLNNKANRQHAFLPGMATRVTQALNQQKENQAAWDKQMAYIKNLNAQADYYNKLANNLNG